MWREQLDRPMRLPLPRIHQDGTWIVSVQRVWLAQGLIPRMIHLDSSPAYNSRHSRETLEAAGATTVQHPTNSLGIAPSDFYRFGNLKEKWQSVAVRDWPSFLSVITQIFSDIPQGGLICSLPGPDEAVSLGHQKRRKIPQELN
jgi:hypothetical protein